MAHEVINGANGSVTWCSGLGCQRCDADRDLNERIRRGDVAEWNFPSGTWYGPPVITGAIPFGTTMRFPATRVE
jgi:hypothetical protein